MLDEGFWKSIAALWIRDRSVTKDLTGKEVELKGHNRGSIHEDIEGADDELP